MTLYLSDLPFSNSWPLSSHERDIRQFTIERHSTQYLTNNFQNCQGCQEQESLKNSHSQEEPKETWQLKVMWFSIWDPGTEKDIRSFAATWMELETLILSQLSQKEKDKYHIYITHMWNLKHSTNDPIYKTDTDSQSGEQTCAFWGRGWREWEGLGVWD